MEKEKVLETLKNSFKMYSKTLYESLEKGNVDNFLLILDELNSVRNEYDKVRQDENNGDKLPQKLYSNKWRITLPTITKINQEYKKDAKTPSYKINSEQIVGVYFQDNNLIVNIEDDETLPIFTINEYLNNNFDNKEIRIYYLNKANDILYCRIFKDVKCVHYSQITSESLNNSQVRVFSLVFTFESVDSQI